ncbi:hypothetical protein [Marinomonas sp. THO17]|uniref:hypothetical protein n=1 Tax=Marinomonas sp. THO17 TaxID=3149048 RepID=UPI00336C1D53
MLKRAGMAFLCLCLMESIAYASDKEFNLDEFRAEQDFSQVLDDAEIAAECFGLAKQIGWIRKAEILAMISLSSFQSTGMDENEALRILLLYERISLEKVEGYTLGRISGISEIINNTVSGMNEKEKEALIASWDVANTRKFNALIFYERQSCDDVLN